MTLTSEVLHGFDNPPPEVVHPEAIYSHPGDERVVFIYQPAR